MAADEKTLSQEDRATLKDQLREAASAELQAITAITDKLEGVKDKSNQQVIDQDKAQIAAYDKMRPLLEKAGLRAEQTDDEFEKQIEPEGERLALELVGEAVRKGAAQYQARTAAKGTGGFPHKAVRPEEATAGRGAH